MQNRPIILIPTAALWWLAIVPAAAQPGAGSITPEQLETLDFYRDRLEKSRRELGHEHPKTLIAMYDVATNLKSMNKLDEAESMASRLVYMRRRISGIEDGWTQNSIFLHADILQRMGQIEKSQQLVEELWQFQKKKNADSHYLTRHYLLNNANLQIASGKFREAEKLQGEYLRIVQEADGENSPDALRAQGKYARLLEDIGKQEEAVSIHEKAWRDAEVHLGADHTVTIENLGNYASSLTRVGKLSEARRLTEESLNRRRKKWGNNHVSVAQELNNLGVILANLHRDEEAEKIYVEAVKKSQKKLGDSNGTTLAITINHAKSLTNLGRYREAQALYSQVVGKRVTHFGDTHRRTLRAMLDEVGFLLNAKEYDKASQKSGALLQQTVETFGAQHPLTIEAMLFHAIALGQTGEYALSEQYHEQALKNARERYGDEYQRLPEMEALLAKSRLRISGRSELALEPARAAVQLISGRRDTIGFMPGDSDVFDPNLLNAYRILADAKWEMASSENKRRQSDHSTVSQRTPDAETFSALQQTFDTPATKAVAINAAQKLIGDEDKNLSALAVRRQSLSDQWVKADIALTEAIAKNKPGDEIKKQNLQTLQQDILSEIARIDQRLRKDAPEYFSLIRPSPLSQKEAKQLVGKDNAGLIIVPGEFGTHLVAVTHTEIVWFRSPWTNEKIDAAVKRLLWDVGANVDVDPIDAARWGDQGQGAYPFDRTTAYTLYQALIEPLQNVIGGKRHLFIAAGGSLSSLPFGLLVSDQPTGIGGAPDTLRATKWFADDHALVRIPSLQSLQLARQLANSAGTTRESETFKGFGNPMLDGAPVERTQRQPETRLRSAASSADLRSLRSLARLPGTEKELRALGQAFGLDESALFLGSRATEKIVRAIDLSNTRILALATHGLVAGELSGYNEPGLVLTPPQTASDEDDGFLSVSEIAKLRLNAEWVILSACNTAAGDGTTGASGLSGLARSFFYAGARNLLVSHWPIRDAVAPIITVRTVEIARDNPALSRAEALQLAMREVRNNRSADSETDTWAHPNAWAPFSLVGDQ